MKFFGTRGTVLYRILKQKKTVLQAQRKNVIFRAVLRICIEKKRMRIREKILIRMRIRMRIRIRNTASEGIIKQ